RDDRRRRGGLRERARDSAWLRRRIRTGADRARAMIPALLLLADGTCFEGTGLATLGTALGEAVFFTGMTGYEEALTDPSYSGQILTFTYPMIGNYGVSRTVSQHPHGTVAGCVMKHLARR